VFFKLNGKFSIKNFVSSELVTGTYVVVAVVDDVAVVDQAALGCLVASCFTILETNFQSAY
jgi:hypothetical protein